MRPSDLLHRRILRIEPGDIFLDCGEPGGGERFQARQHVDQRLILEKLEGIVDGIPRREFLREQAGIQREIAFEGARTKLAEGLHVLRSDAGAGGEIAEHGPDRIGGSGDEASGGPSGGVLLGRAMGSRDLPVGRDGRESVKPRGVKLSPMRQRHAVSAEGDESGFLIEDLRRRIVSHDGRAIGGKPRDEGGLLDHIDLRRLRIDLLDHLDLTHHRGAETRRSEEIEELACPDRILRDLEGGARDGSRALLPLAGTLRRGRFQGGSRGAHSDSGLHDGSRRGLPVGSDGESEHHGRERGEESFVVHGENLKDPSSFLEDGSLSF